MSVGKSSCESIIPVLIDTCTNQLLLLLGFEGRESISKARRISLHIGTRIRKQILVMSLLLIFKKKRRQREAATTTSSPISIALV